MKKQRRRNRKHQRIYTVLALIIGMTLFLIRYLAENESLPESNDLSINEQGKSSQAPLDLDGVGPEGSGGDALLNRQKNRVDRPMQVEDVSVSDLVALEANVLLEQGKRHRKNSIAMARANVEKHEQRGIRLTGYLLAAKQSGKESANGYSDSLRDYHLWIGSTSLSERSESVIAEVTPRWKKVHPEWRLRFLQQLAKQKSQIRVTGWLLWDQEHNSEVERTRATQWEVHPITRIEIFSGGQWRELSEPVS